jgi:ubiquinone/menaquinone biosynthesis C-methylase UbiE
MKPINGNSQRDFLKRIPLWQRLFRYFLDIFFEQLYSSLAGVYDLIAWVYSAGEWHHWQDVGIEALPEGKTLELGHGPGHTLGKLRKAGRWAVGVDLSIQMGRLARKRLLQAQLSPLLARARAENLPFPSNSFQAVLSLFPSNYIYAQDTVAEAWRVLKPSGILVIIPSATNVSGPPSIRSSMDVLAAVSAYISRLGGRLLYQSLVWENHCRKVLERQGFIVHFEGVQMKRALVSRITAKKPGQNCD